jgi:hypothetical protein
LLLLLYDLLQLWLVFGPAAGSGLVFDNTSGLGLTHALARICLHSLGGRKRAWLAFRHCKTSIE